MATCQYKVGFLSLGGCENPVAIFCSSCNRGVCMEHSRMFEGSATCVDCYVQNVPEDEASKQGLGTEYNRRSVYKESGYDPYSDDDYGSFDNAAGVASDYDEELDPKKRLKKDNFQDS